MVVAWQLSEKIEQMLIANMAKATLIRETKKRNLFDRNETARKYFERNKLRAVVLVTSPPVWNLTPTDNRQTVW